MNSEIPFGAAIVMMILGVVVGVVVGVFAGEANQSRRVAKKQTITQDTYYAQYSAVRRFPK